MAVLQDYTKRFSRLEKFYILALSLIAILLLVTHLLVQSYLNIQLNDSRTINLTGRQRMLSQKISKLALQIVIDTTTARDTLKITLKESADEWLVMHKQLKSHETFTFFNTKDQNKIDSMYKAIQPSVDILYDNSSKICTATNDDLGISNYAGQIIAAGESFLNGMDDLVFEYDRIARQKVTNLKQVDIVLLLFAYLILLFEFIFIFRPVTANVKNVVRSLIDSEHQARLLLKEKEMLLNSLQETHQKYLKLQEDQFQRELEQQKLNSLLVIQGQENERQRIAMDIHDGVGQWLTALKYNLEAIDPKADEASLKLRDCENILKEIIKQVRIISFNITPSELVDYGLSTALGTLAQGLTRLSKKRVIFYEDGCKNQRFDTIIEINLFRIAQEAVNNAIKHAACNNISIKLQCRRELLILKIEDDGRGIDLARAEFEEKMNGIKNMKERATLLGGKATIASQDEKGTTVEIDIPVQWKK